MPISFRYQNDRRILLSLHSATHLRWEFCEARNYVRTHYTRHRPINESNSDWDFADRDDRLHNELLVF